jgi:hypothetical protein
MYKKSDMRPATKLEKSVQTTTQEGRGIIVYSVPKSVYTKSKKNILLKYFFPFTTAVVDIGAAPLIAHIFKKRQKIEMVLIQNNENI